MPGLDDQDAIQAMEARLLPEWRATQKNQIDAAVAIISPQARWRDSCRQDVERQGLRLSSTIAMLRANDKRFTKEGKLAAGRLASALRRLERALLDPYLDGLVASSAVARFITPKQITDGIRFCEELQQTPTGKLVRKDAEAKRHAVKVAHTLLTKYHPRKANDATKGSALCKLAALLYGKTNVDLHHQCLTELRQLREKRG